MKLKASFLMLLFLSGLGICQETNSQKGAFPYVDAKVICSFFYEYDTSRADDPKYREIANIFDRYDLDQIGIRGNKFLQFLFENENFKSKYSKIEALLGQQAGETKALGQPAEGLSFPEKIINSLAILIAEHFKQELVLTYIENFQNKVKDLVLFEKLFPGTYELLTGPRITSESLNAVLISLRETFNNDLSKLDENVIDYMKHLQLSDSNKKYIKPESKAMFNSFLLGAEVFQKMRKGENPVQLINRLDGIVDNGYAGQLGELEKLFRIISIVSRSLTNKEGNWIKYSDNREIIKYDYFPRVYLCLVYQNEIKNLEKIRIGNKSLKDTFEDIALQKIDDIQRFIVDISFLTDMTMKQLEELEKEAKPKISDYCDLMLSVLDVIACFSEENPFCPIDQSNRTFLTMVRSFIEIPKNIYEKTYSLAAANALKIIRVVSNIEKGDDIYKYCSFLLSLLNASNPNEMKSVLESVVLPVGSYSTKRNRFSITLNSYAGFAYYYSDKDTTVTYNNGSKPQSYSFFAPVGIDANLNLIPNCLTSLFFSIVDLGAIVHYRFMGNEEEVSEANLKNIFSPGAFAFLGIPKMPLSVGFGVQFSPLIREIDQSGAPVISPSRIRWGFSLTVDIPLLNIY